jgi:pimeloyl-ACP methyl ester carboxylesterase
MVHGTISDYRWWQAQMDEFSQRHRVVAYSLRPCGRSGRADQGLESGTAPMALAATAAINPILDVALKALVITVATM